MLEPLLCGLISQAPLIPKLRGHFAEFLNNASPAGLRILSSSTCVGLRYGLMIHYSGFSWQYVHVLHYLYFVPPCGTGLSFPGSHFRPASPQFLISSGAGISTCCPSTTPSGLALGPDFPRADQLYPGILGYSAWGIPTPISLLIPAFSLHGNPPPLPVRLLLSINAPLPIIK